MSWNCFQFFNIIHEHDVNAYKRVEFFYIYTLFIIYWIKNLDIYKLSIFIYGIYYILLYIIQ